VVVEPLPEKNSASRTIGPNSAIDPAAIMSWPKLVTRLPESLSTGKITPSEVATSTIATNSGDFTNPPASRPRPRTIAITNETPKPITVSFRTRPRKRSMSNSRPARNSRNASPTRARTATGRSGLAHPRTDGPITIPSTISRTIAGIRRRGKNPSASGATTPAATTINRLVK
jgi:hypothetical protein